MAPVLPWCCLPRFTLLATTILMVFASPGNSAGAELAEANYDIRTWDRRSGLPATVINQIQRAPSGYLWLATQKGLVRFDGERFSLFDLQNSPELGTNWVWATVSDERGGLWVATPTGLHCYPNGQPGAELPVEVEPHFLPKALSAGISNTVWALSVSNEVVQFTDRKAVARFVIPGGEAMRELLFHGEAGVLVASATNAMLLKNGKFTPIKRDALTNVRPDLVCRRNAGGFWAAQERDVVRIGATAPETHPRGTAYSPEAPQSAITALLEDRSGRVWVGTRQGVVHCVEAASEAAGWQQITPKRFRTLGFVSCLYEDPEGLVWVGTTAGYLHQIKRRLVTTWSLPLISQESIPQTVCATRDGSVWVGTDGMGAYRFQDGKISHFGAREGLGSDTILSIFEDRHTNLWFGTFSGVFCFENGRFEPQLQSVLKGQPVPVVFEDQAGSIWLGTQGRVLRSRGGDARAFALGSDVEVRALAEGHRGEMWIGTLGGGVFRCRNGVVEKFNRFRHPRVQALYCEARGVAWVGTSTRGLFRIANNQVNNWTSADGLPSSWIHSIIEDSSGTLWFGSNEGIFGITKQALMDRLRSKDSPLLAIQVASPELGNWSASSGQPSAAEGPDGRIWFPVGHGVLSFNPAELIRSRPALPVMIEEVLVEGAKRGFNPVTPELRLYAGIKRLEFRYTIADLDSVGRLKFRYKLEGFDDKWVDAGSQRFATYPALAPGKYRFRVISAGSSDVWTETANPMLLEIVPHFFQTVWFKTLAWLVALGAVGTTVHLIGRAKLRRKLERLEMQQAMEVERQRIARDLHDELGSGITEIMLLSELAKLENGQAPIAAEQVNSQLSDITLKARQVATAMDVIVWTVDPRNDSLPDLASYLCDYAREFLRAANMSCRIDMAENMPSLGVTAQQRHNLLMAVKEALNNAVKHSGATEVWLRIAWSERSSALCVSVEDNGKGFDASLALDNPGGNGLSNMRARMDNIGAAAEFSGQPGQGTKVKLRLPLAEEPIAHSSDLQEQRS